MGQHLALRWDGLLSKAKAAWCPRPTLPEALHLWSLGLDPPPHTPGHSRLSIAALPASLGAV